MQNRDPILSTDLLADLFEQLRGPILLLLIFISWGAAYGFLHVPTVANDEAEVAEASAPQFSEGDEVPSQDEAFVEEVRQRDYHQATTECLLVVEVDDLFDSSTVTAVRHVVSQLEAMPQVARVLWLDGVPNLNMFGLSDPLLPANNASTERFAASRRRTMAHPLARGQLISEDGKTLLMLVWLDWIHITSDEQATTEILEVARRAAAEYPSVKTRIRLTGRVPLYLSAEEAQSRNQQKFQVIGFSLVLVLAVLLFRGVSAVVIVAGAPGLGIFWTLGWLKLFGQLDNPLTGAVLPVLVAMVGFTDGVHLIVHIRAARANGETAMEAAKSAIRKVGLACLLTSLTTAIGFGSLMLASNVFVQEFGRSCAIGVLLTFLAVILFIPLASTMRLGRNIHIGHERDFVRNNLQRLAPLIDWVVPRRRPIAIFSFVITLALLGWSLLALHPDDRLGASQPTGSEAYQALTHCDQVLGGIETVQIRVFWDANKNPGEVLEAVQRARKIFDEETLINNKLDIHDFLSQLPGASNTLAQEAYLALLPEAVQEDFFNKHDRMASVRGRIQDLGIATYKPAFTRVEDRLVELGEEMEGFRFDLHGSPVHRGRQLFQIVVDLATSLGTASIIILTVMAVVYRSWTIGFITIVPNMFPLVVTAAYLLVIGQPLEIASVCSFTVCLGIAVDDSIHFLSRYQDERRIGKQPIDAVRSTFVGVGTALITTTMVLIAGFGTVLTSDLPGHRTFASMACWTIGAALVGDLLFLPALLLCFERDDTAELETKSLRSPDPKD